MKTATGILPTVTVIVPNYNHADYLEERIESILHQTYPDFELIILDDCSTDNSRRVIERYKDHPAVSHIVYNECNSGSTFKQWEKGLLLARAPLIWIAESDDVMDSTFLEKAVNIFTRHPGVSLVQCGTTWINKEGLETASDPRPENDVETPGRAFILNQLLFGNTIYNASAVLFRKNAISLPFHKAIKEKRYCGDWLFWVKVLEHGAHYQLAENLNRYRRHAGNVSFDATSKGLFFLEGVQVYAYIKKHMVGEFGSPDRRDKLWAAQFAALPLKFSLLLKFLKQSVRAGWFLPGYVVWLVLSGRGAHKNYPYGPVQQIPVD